MIREVKVPDGICGSWAVETFTISELVSAMSAVREPGRSVRPGEYKRLIHKGSVVMSNTSAEIRDHLDFFRIAEGSVLINGLGLGIALANVLAKDCVTSVTVIENSIEVITLVAPTFSEDPRVTIIAADAFSWQPPHGVRYNTVWHDIWEYIDSDNLKEMSVLHRKYGRRCDWQDSWCKKLCKKRKSGSSKWGIYG